MCDYKVRDLLSRINKLLGDNFNKPVIQLGLRTYDRENGRNTFSKMEVSRLVSNEIAELGINCDDAHMYVELERNNLIFGKLKLKMRMKKSGMCCSWMGTDPMTVVAIEVFDESHLDRTLKSFVDEELGDRELLREARVDEAKYFISTLADNGLTFSQFEELYSTYVAMRYEIKKEVEILGGKYN